MEIILKKSNQTYHADLSKPLDISIPLEEGAETVNCFYAPFMETAPVVAGDFIGSTQQGGSVNFLNVKFNPHGNGTHTECVGHIAKEPYSIHQSLQKFHHFAKLITVIPTRLDNGDQVIFKNQIESAFEKNEATAVV
ncbi:MAG TPA: cyclase family protein, partial [Phaeodactylibacter sp.]|nr:cyclase family protein [Phaeodactylibacter sp.]